MKYLVDNVEIGELLWVLAKSPEDAAQLAVLDPFCPPAGSCVMVYDLRNGFSFPFWFNSHMEGHA